MRRLATSVFSVSMTMVVCAAVYVFATAMVPTCDHSPEKFGMKPPQAKVKKRLVTGAWTEYDCYVKCSKCRMPYVVCSITVPRDK